MYIPNLTPAFSALACGEMGNSNPLVSDLCTHGMENNQSTKIDPAPRREMMCEQINLNIVPLRRYRPTVLL